MYEEAAMTTTTSVNKLNNNALPSIASTSQLINISNATAANITVAIVSTQQQQQQQHQQALITEMHPSPSSSTSVPTSGVSTILAPIQSASHVAILSGGQTHHLPTTTTTKIIINNNSITTHESDGHHPTSPTTTLCLSSPNTNEIQLNNNNNNNNKSKAMIPNILNNNNSSSSNNNKTNVIVSTNQITGAVTTTASDQHLSYLHHPTTHHHQLQSTQLIIATTVPTVTTLANQGDDQDDDGHLCEVTTLQNLVTTSEQIVSPTSSGGIIVQANNSNPNNSSNSNNNATEASVEMGNDDGGASTSMSADHMVEFDIQDLNNSTDDTSEANLMTLLYGISIGWTSSSTLLLMSDESPLTTGPLSLWQVSWIGSILCVGGATGQLFFGWIADRFGRKPGLALSFIPAVLSWVLIEYGQEFYSLFISRILSGFVGGAVYQIVPLFVSEVSNVEIRGLLGSFLMLFTGLGTLIGYAICSFLPYRTVPWLAISISVIFLLTFSIVPETPKYLMMKGVKEDKLSQSIQFYTGEVLNTSKYESKEGNDETTSMKVKTLCDPASRNAFKVALTVMSCCCFSGVFVVLNYTEKIFKEAGSNLSPAISSIIVASIQLTGCCVATFVVDRAGRRLLIISSAYGSALCLAIMGGHSFLKENGTDVASFEWVPLLCLSLLVFIASNGATTVAFIIIGEIFAQNIRSAAISLCLLYQWSLAFVLVLVFPYLIEFLKMYGALWIFTVIGVVIASVIVFILPETKGRTIDEIVDVFGKEREKRKK